MGTYSLAKAAVEVVSGAVIQGAISTVVTLIVPKVAEMLVRDLVTGVLGPDLGNALAAGANIYLSKNHQGAGGSPGDQEAVFAFKREQNIVLAEEARAERSIKSPFDVTTNSTFLGNITYSLLPLATSFTSVSNTVTNLSNIVASSTTRLLPSATAAGETQLISQAGDCPTINSVGAMADAYCNPYYVSDLDTTEMDPKMLTYAIWENGKKNFQTTEVDGHTEIEYDQFGNPINTENNTYHPGGGFGFNGFSPNEPTNPYAGMSYEDLKKIKKEETKRYYLALLKEYGVKLAILLAIIIVMLISIVSSSRNVGNILKH